MSNKNIEDKRKYSEGKKASMKRRSDINDYYGKHIYMITLVVEGRRPLLGELCYTNNENSETDANVHFSDLGEEVYKCWRNIPQYNPEIKLIAFQIMPDHLHGIFQVQEKMDKHIGNVVNGFKIGCNKAYRQLLAEGKAETLSLRTLNHRYLKGEKKGFLFELGYNDLISKGYDMLPKMINYLKDNPKRLAIRRKNPEYFKVRFDIDVNGRSYSGIGNRFLLERPEKVQIQLSRGMDDKEISKAVAYYLGVAKQGAVLVSPAISKGEQAVMRAGLDLGYPLIFLSPWGFNSFSKPGHQYFEACSQGRFLILAPWVHQNERIELTREMCLELNEMAKGICRGEELMGKGRGRRQRHCLCVR